MSKRVEAVSEAVRLIPVSRAAEFAGKSVKTLKRWVKGGRLNDWREEGDKLSAVMISEQELKACLVEMDVHAGVPGGLVKSETMAVLRAQMALLEKVTEELRSSKDALVEELKRDKLRLLEEIEGLKGRLVSQQQQEGDSA